MTLLDRNTLQSTTTRRPWDMPTTNACQECLPDQPSSRYPLQASEPSARVSGVLSCDWYKECLSGHDSLATALLPPQL